MKLLITLLSLLALTNARSQIKLSQTFESQTFPPSGWSLTYSGLAYWERGSAGAFGMSTGSAAFLFYEAPAGVQQILTSPLFTPATSGDSLRFDHAYATYENRVDSLIIEGSTDSGTTYNRIAALAGGSVIGSGLVTAPPTNVAFLPSSSQWGTQRIPLPDAVNRIRFTAKSDFGNNLYLDNITVSLPFTNDVGVTALVEPEHFINLPFPRQPQATIKNFGTANQTAAFSTTLQITGPGGFSYSSTVDDTLSSGVSRTITFPAAFNPVQPGTYNSACFTNLVSDQSRGNDTIRRTIVAGNYNFGTNSATGDDRYFFANSLAGNGAPSQPEFFWIDTTGSIDLIANGTSLVPMTGDIDDGYFTLTGIFPGKSFRLFGTNYSATLHISTNGVISFAEGYESFQPSAIPSGQTPNGALYALWSDLDFSDPDIAGSKLSYKIDGDLLVITYARAPRFNLSTDTTDYVTFQVCLRFSASLTANSFARVAFNHAETGTGFHAAYSGNAFAHLIGAENANGTSAVAYRYVSQSAPVTPGPLFGSSLAVVFGPSYVSYVRPEIKAMLQGSFAGAGQGMRTDLIPLLPTNQPYTASPWGYTGTEFANLIPDSVVDWVLVELRTDTLASAAVARRGGFIKSDGRIVGTAGSSAVAFDLISAGSYYIVLYQRNHLGVMSSSRVSLSTSSPLHDFTLSQAAAHGSLPMVELSPGIFGMVAGDVNRSGIITAADANLVYGALNSATYAYPDVNMSGIVTAADANVVFVNLNRTSNVPGQQILAPERGEIRYPTFPSQSSGVKKRPPMKSMQ